MSKALELVQDIYEEKRIPTAAVGEEIFTYQPGSGWISGLKIFENILLQKAGTLPLQANQMRRIRFNLPLGSALFEGVHYFEWVYDEHYWSGQWQPLYYPPTTLVFENCVVDLQEMTVTPRSQVKNPIWGPILTLPYKPEAKHKDWEAVLDRFLRPDPLLHDYVQEVASLLLVPHHFAKSFLLFIGPSNTGKSTVMSALAVAPGGLPGQTSLDPVQASSNRFESYALLNRFAAVCEELETLTPRAKSWLKSYTGGRFGWEVKYGVRGSSAPTAKLLAASNALPDFVEDGKAVHNRMVVVPMLTEITKKMNSNFCTAGHWADPGRRAAVVAWMLPGLIRLIQRGFQIQPPPHAEKLKEEIREQTHPITRWFSEHLIVTGDPNQRIPTTELMEMLRHAGFRDLSVRRAAELLLSWGGEGVTATKRAKVDKGGNWTDGRGFAGLAVME